MSRFSNPSPNGGGSNTDTFDKIYVTHNSEGQNVRIGDDAWIGDVDTGNQFAVIGVQNSAQGGIIFGDAKTASIQGDPTNITVSAQETVTIAANAVPGWINMSAYEGAYVNGIDPNNKVLTQADLNSYVPAPALASGAFHDQTTFGPYSANSEQALSYQTTDWSSDVRITGINNSQITFDRAGKFNIQFSSQFHVTSGGAIVYIWLKKNGTTIPWSGTRFDITANNPYAVAAWNWFVDASTNDYYEIFWSTPSNTVKVESITGLTGTKGTVPSNILTVNQVG